KDNGLLLWKFQTDAGVNGSATTFEHQGVQYVAVISAGSMYSPGRHGDSVWLFSLNGELGPLPAPESSPAGGGLLPPGTLAPATPLVAPPQDRQPDLAAGSQIYNQVCAACHGPKGEGGHAGGVPLTAELTPTEIMTVASYGRNSMPPFREVYSLEQLHDVSAYILDDMLAED